MTSTQRTCKNYFLFTSTWTCTKKIHTIEHVGLKFEFLYVEGVLRIAEIYFQLTGPGSMNKTYNTLTLNFFNFQSTLVYLLVHVIFLFEVLKCSCSLLGTWVYTTKVQNCLNKSSSLCCCFYLGQIRNNGTLVIYNLWNVCIFKFIKTPEYVRLFLGN